MKAISLVNELLNRKYYTYSGVPCSIIKPFLNAVIDDSQCEYIPATIEGEAAAISVGTYLAGFHSVILLQNSGLGNLVNPLTSLVQLYRAPALYFITWRGKPGVPDAHQHALMGELTPSLLEVLRIPFEVLEDSGEHLFKTLNRADEVVKNERRPFAIVLTKGLIEPYTRVTNPRYKRTVAFEKMLLGDEIEWESDLPTREDAVQFISKATRGYPVISSTGYTSREFFNAEDRDSNFYMQGSMGYAFPIALGLSRHYKERVFCLDGDASLLMRMGNLATAGAFHKGNLTYILLDNQAHESTGGQATVSSNVRFDKLAEATGFARFIQVNDVSLLPKAISLSKNGGALSFIYIRIRMGKGQKMGRPILTPLEITDRFRTFIKKNQ